MTTHWPLPRRVRVSADGGSLEWEYGTAKEHAAPELRARRRRTLLFRFIRLGRELGEGQIELYPKRVESFAQGWGVFHHHGKLGAGQRGQDDLKRWARTVGSYRGVLGLTHALRASRPPSLDDLRLAMGLFPRGVRDPRVGVVQLACWSAIGLLGNSSSAAESEENLVRVARHAVRLATQTALLASGTGPVVELDPANTGFTMGVRCNSLASALASALLYAVLGAEGAPAFCASCGNPHSPDRRTTAGRRSFCKRCRQDGAPLRLASADYRERRREATGSRG